MNQFDLDQPIIQLDSNTGCNSWTMRHAVEGLQIFGGIGSGKTSGSGRMLALKYLSVGFGGLVLTVKPDEKQTWEEYCKLTGRLHDLVVIEPKGNYSFNFLEYESTDTGDDRALTVNIVEVLRTVIRAGEQKESGNDETFWETALDMLMSNVIDLCKLAYGKISAQLMYDIVQTIPKAEEKLLAPADGALMKPFQKAFEKANANVENLIKNWYEALPLGQKHACGDEDYYENAVMDAIDEARQLRFLDQFFFVTFKNLSEKTRSIIDFIFSGFLYRLLREPVYSLFCKNESNVKPEDSLEGRIILLNLPVKTFHKVGRDCQILFKYIWQRAMERREVKMDSRPVFLWADEAQNFLHEHDTEYQATARSSRIATVYISQNLPNYFASMGGHKAEYRVKSFLGTLGTKIFHSNADIDTNRYGSELIGDIFYEDQSGSVTYSENFSQTRSHSLTLERAVRPEEFVGLKTGGPRNRYRVDGYFHRQGDPITDGRNYIKLAFDQYYRP